MDGQIPIPVIIDVLIPLLFVAYGWKFLSFPPEMNSGKGFVSKYSMISKDTWKYATNYGGKLYIALGVLLGAITAVKYVVFGMEEPQWFTVVYMLGILVLYFVPFFMVRNKCMKKFGHLIKDETAEETAEDKADKTTSLETAGDKEKKLEKPENGEVADPEGAPADKDTDTDK